MENPPEDPPKNHLQTGRAPDSADAAQQRQHVRAKKIGDYVTGKQLGLGSFGDVRLATHQLTNSLVAIKILEKAKIQSERDFQRIVREIQILKLLDHPNVVRLLEVIDTAARIYLITDYVDGGELFDYVQRRGHLTERESCLYFRQIVAAVTYCHRRRVCHRDLKLENVLLTSNNEVKIIDFGLSNIMEEEYKMKTACGSPLYASPEMLGQTYYGPTVDIWALGIILFGMTCGYLPFQEEDQKELYKRIIAGQFMIPSRLSLPLIDLLKKMLEVDATKRITLAQICQHEWFVNTASEVPVPFMDTGLEESPRIDFKLIAAMKTQLPQFNSQKMVRAILEGKHNQMTATYYLMSEKQTEEYKVEEQRLYAAELGYQLTDQGIVIKTNALKDGSDDEK